jgi:hypothetical protein
MDTLRPLAMFLGLTGPALCISADAFSPPVRKMDKSLIEKVRSRITLNFAFFLTNYALVVLGVAIVVALSHPGMLLFLGVVYGLWWIHSYMIHNEVLVGGMNLGTILSISQRTTVLSVVTAVVIVWKCLVPVVSFVAISGLLVLSHACMRDPNHIENTGDLLRDGEDDEDEDYHIGGSNNKNAGTTSVTTRSRGSDSSGESGVIVERGDVI